MKDPSTGRRVSWMNPESEWIIKDVPDLRIIDDDLWQAVRRKQTEIAAKYANVITAVRKSAVNRLNGTHRPKALFSGMVFCGVCGGTYRVSQKNRRREASATVVAPYQATLCYCCSRGSVKDRGGV